jgi:glutathione S-transferase
VTAPVIVGRSSSHFTRVPRVIAHALAVPYTLEVVRDLSSTDPRDYAGNPSIKIPSLRVDGEVIFGAEPSARRIAAMSGAAASVAWPEDMTHVTARNAHEVVWTAMSTQVQLAIATHFHPIPRTHPLLSRLETSLGGALAWLELHAEDVSASLPPERTTSLFEVALVCLVEHLSFRPTLSSAATPRLAALASALGERAPFASTRYRLDAV